MGVGSDVAHEMMYCIIPVSKSVVAVSRETSSVFLLHAAILAFLLIGFQAKKALAACSKYFWLACGLGSLLELLLLLWREIGGSASSSQLVEFSFSGYYLS